MQGRSLIFFFIEMKTYFILKNLFCWSCAWEWTPKIKLIRRSLNTQQNGNSIFVYSENNLRMKRCFPFFSKVIATSSWLCFILVVSQECAPPLTQCFYFIIIFKITQNYILFSKFSRIIFLWNDNTPISLYFLWYKLTMLRGHLSHIDNE